MLPIRGRGRGPGGCRPGVSFVQFLWSIGIEGWKVWSPFGSADIACIHSQPPGPTPAEPGLVLLLPRDLYCSIQGRLGRADPGWVQQAAQTVQLA